MKTIDTLIRDIYVLLESREVAEGVDLDSQCASFGRAMADVLREQLSPREDNRKLRLSAIGKPDRQIYNSYHGVEGEPIRGATYIKFLYGHLVEAMLLALVRCSGHEVTGEQKEVEVDGVKGHIDGYIDGVLMDVKSCSSFGFKKFQKNTLHEDDPFGYIPQLKAYAHAEGQTKYGWLAMDKQNGTLAWLQYDETHTDQPYAEAIDWSVPQRIADVKKLVDGPLPALCYEDLPDGKSGNRKLAMGCSYCQYKDVCYPELRTFYYSNGPRYLTKVVKDPRVMEIPDDF
jgi:hypothetical protein